MTPLLLALLVISPAHAGDTGDVGSDASSDPVLDADSEGEDGATIVVEAERSVALARKELVDAIEAEGFPDVRREPGRTVFLGEPRWRGRVVLYDDGWLEVHVGGATPTNLVPMATAGDGASAVLGATVAGVFWDPRAAMGSQARVLDALDPLVDRYADAIADRALLARLDEVSEQLAAVWWDGVAPDGRPLDTIAERRAEVGAMWLHTADNDAGQTVRDRIARFVEDVVDDSRTPFTDEEIAAINARRGFEDELIR